MSSTIQIAKIEHESFAEHQLASLAQHFLLVLPKMGGGQLQRGTGCYYVDTSHVFFLAKDRQIRINWSGSVWLISFDAEQLRAFLRFYPEEQLLPIFQPGRECFTMIFPERAAALQSLAELLYREHHGENNGKVTTTYLFSILVHLATAYRQANHISPAQQNSRLVEKVLKLVEKDYRTEKSPVYYAGQLGTTVRKLNALTRRSAGKTITELIAEKLLADAEHLLSAQTLSIKEIAYELDFADMAQFCHFLKRHTGLSPTEYRKRLKYNAGYRLNKRGVTG